MKEFENDLDINKTYSINILDDFSSYIIKQENSYFENISLLESNKKIIEEYRKSSIQEFKLERDRKIVEFDKRYNKLFLEKDQKEKSIEEVMELLDSYEDGTLLSNTFNNPVAVIERSTLNFTPYHKTTFIKIYKNHFIDNRHELQNLLLKLNNDFTDIEEKNYRQIYKDLLDKEIELKIDILNNQLEDLQNKILQEYNDKETDIINNIKNFVISKYSKDILDSYILKSKQYDIEKNYKNKESMPKFLKLGNISKSLSNKYKIFDNILNDMYPMEYYRDSKLILPYCQNISEGISLYIRTINSQRTKTHDFMKYLIMKLFITMPAGKMEATFIDPLELGETFSLFSKLGDEEERIIDTRIWSKKEEITEKIRTFRQVLETRTQDYGVNKKNELLKKESIKLLAITDFPTGFTEESLADLRAIIRKSSEYGIIIMICGAEIPSQNIYIDVKKEISNNLDEIDMTKEHAKVVINEKEYHFIPEIDYKIFDRSSYYIQEMNKYISTYVRRIESFENLFIEDIDDPNNWRNDTTLDGISIPIGIKGADSILKLDLGVGTTQHALIAGQTGGGKTTLLHTIIMSLLLKYSADELQLYLADFKEGIEFKPYTELKCNSFKVIAIDSEREFGLNLLEKLCKELKSRSETIAQEGCTDIVEYRKITHNKMPKIILIFDEIHELLIEEDDITNKSLQCLNKLVTQGRALGIHLILACQDFRLATGINNLFSQIAVRIAIKGDEESAGSILSSDNDGFKSLSSRPSGSALYNDHNGVSSANQYFQVAYLKKEKRLSYLQTLSSIEQSLNPNEVIKTKFLLSRIEDDYFSKFNQFILNDTISPISNNNDCYGIIVGENFKLDNKFFFEFTNYQHSNLIVVGKGEEAAYSIFQYLTISILYEELSNEDAKKDNELVDILDCSIIGDELSENISNFNYLSSKFNNNQVKTINPREIEKIISLLTERLENRIQGNESCNENIFFMIFGLDRLHKLKSSNPYQQNVVVTNLLKLLDKGSEYGIHVIVWTKNINVLNSILGDGILSLFSLRILLDGNEKDYEEIVHEYNSKNITEKTAVFIDIDDIKDNVHFRTYKNPSKRWISKYAEIYHKHEDD